MKKENHRKTPNYHKILKIRNLSENTFVIRFEKKEIDFIPGQFLSLGPASYLQEREYSIYSGINDPWFEILIRIISDGDVSDKLHSMQAGELLKVSPPEGKMILPIPEISKSNFMFIGTGTGIAPFRSFIRSYPDINYKIIHGVGFFNERYDYDEYDNDCYVSCISREKEGDYQGRVNGYIAENEIPSDTFIYLCGNSNMIYEAYGILREKGIKEERIFSEVYF